MNSRLIAVVAVAVLAIASPLVDFQVAQPPPIATNVKQCSVFLFDHTFGNSFGQPALADLRYASGVLLR